MNQAQFEIARQKLSAFLLEYAHKLSKRIGIGYTDSDDAPSDYDSLMAKWAECKRTGRPFPVWNGASESCVYTSIGSNFAFRFWHDYLHYTTDLKFTTIDEIKIGIIQTEAVQKHFGMDSLEAKIMLADTVGQSLYAFANNGEFPENQLSYVYALLSEQK